MNSLIEQLNWRYATKKYDTSKKISEENLTVLKESMRLAPTAFGLQAMKVLIIETSSLREKLREHSFGQPQITEASHLFVFLARTDVDDSDVSAYMQRISAERNIPLETISSTFGEYIKGYTGNLSKENLAIWNAKQCYIALGMLVEAAAVLSIDASPMEGFSPADYDTVLGLEGYSTIVVAAAGYRSAEDATQHYPKVRKSNEDFFEIR